MKLILLHLFLLPLTVFAVAVCDTNSDGNLTFDELSKQIPSERLEKLKKLCSSIDIDGNGFDRKEWAECMKVFTPMIEWHFTEAQVRKQQQTAADELAVSQLAADISRAAQLTAEDELEESRQANAINLWILIVTALLSFITGIALPMYFKKEEIELSRAAQQTNEKALTAAITANRLASKALVEQCTGNTLSLSAVVQSKLQTKASQKANQLVERTITQNKELFKQQLEHTDANATKQLMFALMQTDRDLKISIAQALNSINAENLSEIKRDVSFRKRLKDIQDNYVANMKLQLSDFALKIEQMQSEDEIRERSGNGSSKS